MKTLGVKFEVAGVKEAQTSLDSLRKNLNAAIAQNKRAIQSSKNLKISTSKDELKVEKDQQELLRVWRIPPNSNSPVRKFIRSLIESGRETQERQKNLFKDVKVYTSKNEFKVEKDKQELLRVWRIPPE